MSVTQETFRLSQAELRMKPGSVFTLMDKLGEGSYGAVFKAMHKATGLVVACKIVPVDNDLEDLLKEINVMTDCDNDAIVRLYGSFYSDDRLHIFIEYCAAGSVADMMRLCRSTMTEQEISVIVRGALRGLEYLHDRRKIHRDIKAGNILLNTRGESKLADFGVAGQLSDTVAKRNTVIGTPFWMAPEIIQEVGYGTAADIWSLGITCIEMAEGRPPHHNIHPMRAIFIIPTRPPPTLDAQGKFSQQFNSFIARCLTKDPTQRPSAGELLRDPFLSRGPGVAILLDKVQRTAELIAQGALNVPDNGDDDEDASSDTGAQDEFKGDAGTMRPADDFSGTMKPAASSQGTMIVNSGVTSGAVTMNGQQADDSYTPAFSKLVINGGNKQSLQKEKEINSDMADAYATMKPRNNNNNSNNKNSSSNNNFIIMNAPQADDGNAAPEELNEMLKALEANMEKEIAQIRSKYERKRAPIIDAIHAKKPGAVM